MESQDHRLHRNVCMLCKQESKPLFKFPKDPRRMKIWLQLIEKSEVLRLTNETYIYNNGRLCSLHFDEKAFTSSLRTKLSRFALPIDVRKKNEIQTDESLCMDVTGVKESVESYIITPKYTENISLPEIRQRSVELTPKTRTIRNLRSKYSKIKKKLYMAENALQSSLQDRLTSRQYEFVKSQIKLGKRAAHGRRWTAKEKAFALNIYLQSSSTYELLRQHLVLPCKNTLRNATINVAKDDGFCPVLFNALSRKVKSLSPEERVCTLVFDEMALKSQVAYNATLDKIDGFESVEGEKSRLATQALVFMLRGIMQNWKQVIAYYFRAHTCPEGWLKKNVLFIIEKVMSCGLKVIAIVCDQGPINQALFKALQVTVEEPYFNFEDSQIFALYDVPHLIKSVRNNLKRYNCKFTCLKNNTVHVASWKDIEAFYEMDLQDSKYRIAPKLTNRHFSAKGLSSMKVSLATQVFSHSVATGLYVGFKLGLSPTCLETATFVNKMDKIFDSMNSKSRVSSKKFACAVSEGSDHVLKWQRWSAWIKTWEFVNDDGKTVRTPCKQGLILSLNASIGIWDAVKDNFSYLLTNRLNQDCIENTFSSIRRRGGFRDNPSPLEFRSAIRNVIVHNFMKKTKSKNCQDDDTYNLIDLSQTPPRCLIQMTADDDDDDEKELIIDESEEQEPTFSEKDRNVVAYVSGVLTRSFLKKSPCDDCKALLVGPKILEDHTFLLYFKEYKYSANGLLWPTNAYFNYILQLGDIFFQQIDVYYYQPSIRKNLYMILQTVNFDFFDHHHHGEVKHFIIHSFVTMMIRHYIKIKNECSFVPNNRKKLKHVLHQ